MARNKTSPKAIERRHNMNEALRLRARGKLYREIAEELGCSEGTAHGWVSDAMAEIPRESAETVFHIELDRLDMAQKALLPGVEAGDPKSIEAWLKIHDKRVKLFHLDKVHGGNQDNGEGAIAMFSKAVEQMYEMQKRSEDE